MKKYYITGEDSKENVYKNNRTFVRLSYAKDKCAELNRYYDGTLCIREIEVLTLSELEKQLERETERRKEAEEVIDFYAKTSSWLCDLKKTTKGKKIFDNIDVTDYTTFDYQKYNHCTIGGKRAREYEEKYKDNK